MRRTPLKSAAMTRPEGVVAVFVRGNPCLVSKAVPPIAVPLLRCVMRPAICNASRVVTSYTNKMSRLCRRMNSVSIFTHVRVVIPLMLIQAIFATCAFYFGGLTGRGLTFSRICELTVGSGCRTVRFIAPRICLSTSSCCVACRSAGPLVDRPYHRVREW